MKVNQDWFSGKAKDYDSQTRRTKNVENIAKGMLKEIPFSETMRVMDFGAGTGLLLSEIAPYVGHITAVDISSSMIEELRKKTVACKVDILQKDLTKETINETFDAVISSMTFHHIEHIEEIFQKLYSYLNVGAWLAVADLDQEDGSFHTESTGVYHQGFDRETLKIYAEKAGFENIKIQSVSQIKKEQACYSVFLLTAQKL